MVAEVVEVQRVEFGGALLNLLVYEAKTDLEMLLESSESEVDMILVVVSSSWWSSEAD